MLDILCNVCVKMRGYVRQGAEMIERAEIVVDNDRQRRFCIAQSIIGRIRK